MFKEHCKIGISAHSKKTRRAPKTFEALLYTYLGAIFLKNAEAPIYSVFGEQCLNKSKLGPDDNTSEGQTWTR